MTAMVYLYLYGKSRDDQGGQKIHQDCLEHLSGRPEIFPNGATGPFATTLAAFNDWAAITQVLTVHPLLGPVRDLQLALTLNAPNQHEIACPAVFFADAMKEVDGEEVLAQVAAERSMIEAYVRDHHVKNLRPRVLAVISAVIPSGALDIVNRFWLVTVSPGQRSGFSQAAPPASNHV